MITHNLLTDFFHSIRRKNKKNAYQVRIEVKV